MLNVPEYFFHVIVGVGDPLAMQWTETEFPIVVITFVGCISHFGDAEKNIRLK